MRVRSKARYSQVMIEFWTSTKIKIIFQSFINHRTKITSYWLFFPLQQCFSFYFVFLVCVFLINLSISVRLLFIYVFWFMAIANRRLFLLLRFFWPCIRYIYSYMIIIKIIPIHSSSQDIVSKMYKLLQVFYFCFANIYRLLLVKFFAYFSMRGCEFSVFLIPCTYIRTLQSKTTSSSEPYIEALTFFLNALQIIRKSRNRIVWQSICTQTYVTIFLSLFQLQMQQRW